MVELVERQLPAWGEPGQHEKALGVLSCLVDAMVLPRAADDPRLWAARRGQDVYRRRSRLTSQLLSEAPSLLRPRI